MRDRNRKFTRVRVSLRISIRDWRGNSLFRVRVVSFRIRWYRFWSWSWSRLMMEVVSERAHWSVRESYVKHLIANKSCYNRFTKTRKGKYLTQRKRTKTWPAIATKIILSIWIECSRSITICMRGCINIVWYSSALGESNCRINFAYSFTQFMAKW